MPNQKLVEIGYLNENNQVSQRFSQIGSDFDGETDCERVKNLDNLLNKLLGKKESEEFRNRCNQILDEIKEFHSYQPHFETGDRLRHIYLMLIEERIDSVLREDYSYNPGVGLAINPDSKQPTRDLVSIANSSLHPIERKSQSIEEWAGDIQRAYVQGEKRPDFIGLLLQRCGECYFGSVYVQKDDINSDESINLDYRAVIENYGDGNYETGIDQIGWDIRSRFFGLWAENSVFMTNEDITRIMKKSRIIKKNSLDPDELMRYLDKKSPFEYDVYGHHGNKLRRKIVFQHEFNVEKKTPGYRIIVNTWDPTPSW